jgi:hypothetical protein
VKVNIVESTPGEFDLPADELRGRILKAARAAFQGVAPHDHGPLGGEVEAVQEVADLTAQMYERRRKALLADIAKLYVEHGGSGA